MLKNGDLSLLGDYWLIGLGTSFKVLPNLVEGLVDVTGASSIVRASTGIVNGLRISTIAIAGGPGYAESIVALAYVRKVKALIGIGMCGALQRDLEIGDVVLPIAAMRDEDTSDHYVDKKYPAVANYHLLKLVEEELRSRGYRPRVGIVVTTSSTFTEGAEWARKLEGLGVLCVECETSVIYTLSTLCRIPAVVTLIVSDHVLESRGPNEEELKKVRRNYVEVAKALRSVFTKYARIIGHANTPYLI